MNYWNALIFKYIIQSVFFFTIQENESIGHEVGACVAIDADADANVTYKLVDKNGQYSKLFTIGKTTGVIRTRKALDFEVRRINYFVYVLL